jgi:hypothetical protein
VWFGVVCPNLEFGDLAAVSQPSWLPALSAATQQPHPYIMSTREELTAAIEAKGNEIRELKAVKPPPPTIKADLEPLIAQLNALKTSYKNLTGEDFGPPPKADKEKEKKAAPEEKVEREGPSKSELNKLKRKEATAAAKAADRAAREAANPGSASSAAPQSTTPAPGEEDPEIAALYGDYPVIMSTGMTEKVYREVSTLNDVSLVGQSIWIRGRLANSRAVGKGIFFVLRQHLSTAQAVMFQGSRVSKQMVKYAAGISLESIVDILAEITVPAVPIESVSIKTVELQIKEVHVVSRAQELPFMIEDAGRNEEEAAKTGMPTVLQETSLNFRWIDTRTPANQVRTRSGFAIS